MVSIHFLTLLALSRCCSGNARLAGIEKDLKLVGYDYNTLLSSKFRWPPSCC
jgi:hypothetical protein